MDNGIGNWPTLHRVRHPHRVALIDATTGAEYTFEQLDLRTNALADALRSRGIGRGDRVALLALNSTHMLEVVFAVAKLGAVAVPINWRLQAPEVQYILNDSGARLLFVSPQTAALARAAAEGTEVSGIVEIPSGEQRAAGEPSEYEALIAEGSDERVPVDVAADDLSMLMYTSGTTGFPKGAMLTHANHHWNGINNLTAGDGVGPRDVNIASAPLFHIGALGVITLPLLYIGGTTVVLETFTPDAWLDAVAKHRVSVAFAVPAMWAAIDASPAVETADLSSLRFGKIGRAHV